MTHYESICQNGMTHPIYYGYIVIYQEMEVSVIQKTNIGGCWSGLLTNLHKSLLLPLPLSPYQLARVLKQDEEENH